MTSKKALQTRLVNSDYTAPEGFVAYPIPVHYASTVIFKDVATMRGQQWADKTGYTYGLHGTPATFALEARLAEIEDGKHCLLAPSGLAAITLVNFGLLRSGDDVLIPENAYGPGREMGAWLMRDFGISARYYDPLIGAGIADLIRPNTKLIWTEAPGSFSMEVPDIPAICQVAHAAGAIVAIDNTWSAGLSFSAFSHGVDVVMQALTKYQSGGSDILMGAVIVRDDVIRARLDQAHMRLGMGVGANDVFLVARSLPTLKIRYEAHDKSARQVAAWLQARPEIAKVLHPACEDCPGHANWKRDFTGAGSVFSIVFDARYSEAQTDRFVESLKLFTLGYSWGGAESLCVPMRMHTIRPHWQEPGQLVRLYVGLEDTQDLIADIAQALALL
jgi:cystathionine beta-lyase